MIYALVAWLRNVKSPSAMKLLRNPTAWFVQKSNRVVSVSRVVIIKSLEAMQLIAHSLIRLPLGYSLLDPSSLNPSLTWWIPNWPPKALQRWEVHDASHVPPPSRIEEEVIKLAKRSEDNPSDCFDCSTTTLCLYNHRLGFLPPFLVNHASCNFTMFKVTTGDRRYPTNIDRHKNEPQRQFPMYSEYINRPITRFIFPHILVVHVCDHCSSISCHFIHWIVTQKGGCDLSRPPCLMILHHTDLPCYKREPNVVNTAALRFLLLL